MSSTTKSGIQTSADGSAYIPSSTRSDGSTRKQIRVRPGYRPPEDVETYKNRSAEAWKNRGSGGVPGAANSANPQDTSETKSKNAKRREAAKRKQEVEVATAAATAVGDQGIGIAMDKVNISDQTASVEDGQEPDQSVNNSDPAGELELERQKKIRNHLKKLRAVRELKDKKASGEKLSHDQLMKIGKEDELLRDLKKLGHDGPDLTDAPGSTKLVEDNTG